MLFEWVQNDVIACLYEISKWSVAFVFLVHLFFLLYMVCLIRAVHVDPCLMSLSILLQKCIRSFIQEGSEVDVLELQVQDPFHRLLLHGICEVNGFWYNHGYML